jgi:hypothetical protein
MEALQQQNVLVEGESLELWTQPSNDFSCHPDDIQHYITVERWDLVFNALCYLAGAVEEGLA